MKIGCVLGGNGEKSKEKIEKINEAIKAMHEDGTFTELSNKWFGLDTTKEN